MGKIDDLYLKFENFDKPNEQDFKEFIDLSGFPNTFIPLNLIPITDIISDLNTIAVVLDIRETRVVNYGSEVWLFTAQEGSYGLNGVLINSSMVTLISDDLSSGLLADLTAGVNLGGIKSGTIFPLGTNFDSMWRSLLTTTSISSLTYTANIMDAVVEVGVSVDITRFDWTVQGSPENMTLVDSDGILNLVVTGNSEIVSQSYVKSNGGFVTWTLASSNAGSTSRTTDWVYKTYFGRSLNGNIPIEADILAGDTQLLKTNVEVTIPINTIDTEYGWIAVHVGQTNGAYNNWYISDLNASLIGPGEFIEDKGNVTVSGELYTIYMYNYSSSVNTIKLFK